MIAYRYDAVGRRVESVRSQYDANGTETTSTTRFYYDGQNVIAEYAYTPATETTSATETLVRTYVNGTQYIDERIVMRNHTGTGDYRGDHYYLHEELYSVAGLARANGSLEEAYVYDTYGQARIYQWREGDFGRNGVIGDTDDAVDTDYLLAHLSGSGVATPEPFLDLDGDGDADGDDVDEFMDNNGRDWLAPVELASSEVGNPYLFTGRPTNTLGSLTYAGVTEYKRIQDNRNRVYDPKHGRWMQRDPAGCTPNRKGRLWVQAYLDSMSLYSYAGENPLIRVDPDGRIWFQIALGVIGAGIEAYQIYQVDGWEGVASVEGVIAIGLEGVSWGAMAGAGAHLVKGCKAIGTASLAVGKAELRASVYSSAEGVGIKKLADIIKTSWVSASAKNKLQVFALGAVAAPAVEIGGEIGDKMLFDEYSLLKGITDTGEIIVEGFIELMLQDRTVDYYTDDAGENWIVKQQSDGTKYLIQPFSRVYRGYPDE